MITQITTQEWKKISYAKLGLNQEQAKSFKKFLEDTGLTTALDFQLDGIKTEAHVGIIRFADFQLNILPKIIGENDSSCLENLMFMLRYTKKLEIHMMGSAEISKTKQPFLEILIAHYANILLNSLQRHIPHHYETKEDNLPAVRGRILFAKNQLANMGNLARVYCQFDEFTSDNLLNQTFKFVAQALCLLTAVPATRARLNKILAIYEDVELRAISYVQAKKILLNRNQLIFKDVLDLALLFLQHSTISLHNKTFTNLAILFDMNKLFEEFVAAALEKAFPGQVQTQKSLTIIDSINGYTNTSYSIRPDILFRNDTIIDTKYKILDLPDNKPSEADIYQMLAYNRFFNRRNILLCYPTLKQHYSQTTIFENTSIRLSLLTLDFHQPLTEEYIQKNVSLYFLDNL